MFSLLYLLLGARPVVAAGDQVGAVNHTELVVHVAVLVSVVHHGDATLLQPDDVRALAAGLRVVSDDADVHAAVEQLHQHVSNTVVREREDADVHVLFRTIKIAQKPRQVLALPLPLLALTLSFCFFPRQVRLVVGEEQRDGNVALINYWRASACTGRRPTAGCASLRPDAAAWT